MAVMMAIQQSAEVEDWDGVSTADRSAYIASSQRAILLQRRKHMWLAAYVLAQQHQRRMLKAERRCAICNTESEACRVCAARN